MTTTTSDVAAKEKKSEVWVEDISLTYGNVRLLHRDAAHTRLHSATAAVVVLDLVKSP